MDFTLQLIETITNNFSDDQKVGSGGYGDVYRAVHNGEQIAVKKLHSSQGLDDEEFDNEFRNLTKIRHENVVRLIGYCSEVGHKRSEHNGELVSAGTMERVLCFEYMEGGSLDKHIADDSCGLNLTACYNIIKGICEGLKHLHTAQEKPIFHLDLKPANVLLDERMTPKIADIGSSRLIISTKTQQSEMRTRTQGYMPPEYVDNGCISEKFDVFSLGVIIIRMLAGNKGCSRFSVLFLWGARLSEMSPKTFIELVSESCKNRFSSMRSPLHLRTCVEIALRCVDTDPEKRPSIEDIVHGLEELEAKMDSINFMPYDHRGMALARVDPGPYFVRRYCQSCSAADDQMVSKPHHLPLQHLKDITDNFSDERILGRGGFGVVYKGVLENGKMVAVKKLVQAMPSSQEQFENEVNILMQLEHPNIVRLVGYCYETQHLRMPHEGKFVFAWDTETLLCLECLPNGSLDKYISDASSGLDWHTRYKIIEGISFGLKYLHEQSNDPIIHLDLKPANILLDKNMVPKITDFGLSRLFDQKQTICTAATNGTLGYMPPEYLRGIITPMSDIFSLGVIIMEIITGHRDYPYDFRTSSEDFIELELKKWRIMLQKEPGCKSLETDCQQIKTCIQIGLICVNPERTKRPTIKKIVDMLQGLESMNWYISNELSSLDIQAGQ